MDITKEMVPDEAGEYAQLTLNWWKPHEVTACHGLVRAFGNTIARRDPRRAGLREADAAFAAVVKRNRRHPLNLQRLYGTLPHVPAERVVSLSDEPAAMTIRALRYGKATTGRMSFAASELLVLQEEARAARMLAHNTVWPEGMEDDVIVARGRAVAADLLRVGDIPLVQLLEEPLE